MIARIPSAVYGAFVTFLTPFLGMSVSAETIMNKLEGWKFELEIKF